jgi:hypothetical protein
MKRFWVILAAFLGLAATAMPASADMVWTLNNGGSILSTPGNYGTITATQLGAGTAVDPYHVQVKIDLAAGERFVTTGSHDGIIFNLEGSPTLQSILVTSANASKFTVLNAPSYATGSYDDSPFAGPFEYAISWNGNGASNATESSITFDITAVGGLVLTPTLFSPSGTFYFAVDIGSGCSTGDNGKTSCGFTGAVAAGDPPTKVPEPGTVTMSIAGLMGMAGLVMLRRRRKLASV